MSLSIKEQREQKKKDRLKSREVALLQPIVKTNIDDLDKTDVTERKVAGESTECTKLQKKKLLEAKRAEARELADLFRQKNALLTTGQAPLIDRAYYDQLTTKAEHETNALKLQMQENHMQSLREINELKQEYELKVRMAEQRGRRRLIKNLDQKGDAFCGSFSIVRDIGQIHNVKLFPTWSPEEIREMERVQSCLSFGKNTYRYCRTLRNLAKEEFEMEESGDFHDYVVNDHLDFRENNSDGKLPVYDFWLESENDDNNDASPVEQDFPGCPRLDSSPLYTEEEMKSIYTIQQRILLHDLANNLPPDWSKEIADRSARRKRIREPFNEKRREIDEAVDKDDSIKEPALKKRKKGELKIDIDKQESILLEQDMKMDDLSRVCNEREQLTRCTFALNVKE